MVWRIVVIYVTVAREDASTADRVAEGQLIIGTATALLTITIAGATWWYASLTSRLVGEAQEQLEVHRRQMVLSRDQLDLGRQQLELVRKDIEVAEQQVELVRGSNIAASRALLVDVPWGVHVVRDNSRTVQFPHGEIAVTDRAKPLIPNDARDHACLYVPVRNIGAGTAVITGISIGSSNAVTWCGTMNPAIVPPSELSELVFAVPKNRPELEHLVETIERRGPLTVYVGYTNSAGEDELWTRLDLVNANDTNHLRVRQVAIYGGNPRQATPFMQSGPSGA